jgi:hypothetical protein
MASTVFEAVFRIQVPRIRKFLGLLDQDPLVRVTDPDPSITEQKCKKNFDFYCFVTSLRLFIFEELCLCTFKKYQVTKLGILKVTE